MRPLIEAHKLYLALPPLYKITYANKEIKYSWDNQQLRTLTDSQKDYTIQRYKGLGEMNADQLWETTMDPKTRSLIKISINDGTLAEKRVSILMGDNVTPRKEWIEENVEFSLEDNNNYHQVKDSEDI